MGGGREEGVALPAPTARGDHSFLAVLQDFRDDLAGVEIAENCSRRDRHDDVGAGSAALVRAHAVLAAFSQPLVAVRVVEKGREIGVAADDDAPAAAPVAAVGAAHWGSPLAAEGGAARATGTSFDFDYDSIDEHLLPRRLDRGAAAWIENTEAGSGELGSLVAGSFFKRAFERSRLRCCTALRSPLPFCCCRTSRDEHLLRRNLLQQLPVSRKIIPRDEIRERIQHR